MFALSEGAGALSLSGGGASASSASQTNDNVAGRGRQEATMILKGNRVLDLDAPRSVDEFAQMMEEVSGRRVRVVEG